MPAEIFDKQSDYKNPSGVVYSRAPSSPVISIIIPTLKEDAFLERTLENLKGLQLPHEIIITDGGSTDRTLDIARRYTDKVVVWGEPRRQTFGEAKNAGAALATSDYLVFIDADVTIPKPNAFFKEMVAAFETRPTLVALTVPLLPWKENHSWMDAFFCTPLNVWYIISNNLFHYGNASGEFQMVRRSVFVDAGGYREDLAGGEDTDFFNRVGRIGRTLSYWRLSVRHSCRRAHKTGWLKLYWMWARQGFSVLLLSRTAYKEWAVIR
jgi:glycosyltransferase involved in cell wall biosynthesis